MTARTSRPPPSRSRQRYALLVNCFEDEHEQSIVQGTLATARELDARLVVVVGGPVESPDPRLRACNFVFDLVGKDNSLGLLVSSSTLGNAAGPQRLGEWLERYAGLPTVSLGVPVQGYVSVRVDNGGGIRAAVRHLIEVHGKQNIGFIRGPVQSAEAELRYAAYRDELLSHGIEPDPRWVAEGDYSRPSGAQGVRTILDQKRVSVHALSALLCANDYMALGALEELGRRGINVPEQLALFGFDDVPSAEASRPALTTVRQPGEELGRQGLKRLLLGVPGAVGEDDHVLPVELRLRRSCGCEALEVGLAQRMQGSSPLSSFEAALIQRRQVIVAELARAARGGFGAGGSDWEGALLSALIEELRDGKRSTLSRRVQRLLLKLEQAGSDLALAPLVLSTLRSQALPCVAGGGEPRDRLEEAIADAQQVTAMMVTQSAVSQARAHMQRLRTLSRLVHEQMFVNPAAVSRSFAEHLPGLGVESCVVASLLEDEPERLGTVQYGFGPGKGHPEPETLPLTRLTEHPLVEGGRTLFLLPVVLAGEVLGLAAFSVTARLVKHDLLEDVRELLSTALKVTQTRHA